MRKKQATLLLITETMINNFFEIEITETNSGTLTPKKSLPVFGKIIGMDKEKITLTCFKTSSNQSFQMAIFKSDHTQVRLINKKIFHVEFLHEIGNKKDFSRFYSMNAYRIPSNARKDFFEWGTGIKLKELNFNMSSLEMKEEALAA